MTISKATTTLEKVSKLLTVLDRLSSSTYQHLTPSEAVNYQLKLDMYLQKRNQK